jgi:hypothetical protein
MTKRTLLRSISPRWLRGPAWPDGDAIAIDGARAEWYQVLAHPTVGLELARVQSPADAVAFATRFGLLRTAPALDWEPLPAVLRESLEQFLTSARILRHVLETTLDVRRADAGNPEAFARLRATFVIPDDADEIWRVREDGREVKKVIKARDGFRSRAERLVDADDRTVLIKASESAAWHLTSVLAGAQPSVFDRAAQGEAVSPGHLRLGILPETLEQACYLSVAVALAEKEPLDICPECRRVFLLADPRQKFCTPACAGRSRYRRFTTKQHRKGSRPHGKATRTRRR